MTKTITMISQTRETIAEARLWQAVILNTIQDWISGPLRLKHEAEEYIFGKGSDFPLVCRSAGMDPGRLRSNLMRLRERRLSRRVLGNNCASPA